MATPRGKWSPWQLGLLIIAVKQMALLCEAGMPFLGYGDGGGMEYPPQMNEHYGFRYNGWPAHEGPPPSPYECGNVIKGRASKYSRSRQLFYVCITGKGREPSHGAYGGNQPSYPPPPHPREIRSGPYFLQGGPEVPVPPHIPDYYYPHFAFPHPPPGQYERPYDAGPPGGGGGRGGHMAGTSRPTMTYLPPVPSPWEEDGEDYSSYPPLLVRGEPKLYGYGGPMSFGPNSEYRPGGGAGARPTSGPSSTGPMQFAEAPSDDSNSTSPTPQTESQPRQYSPYMRYGLRLLQ